MTIEELFKQAGKDGKEFRGAPFWSWNDDLDPDELRRQIRSMCASGMGGHFMHARVGLITPYLSEEYVLCHEACIDESRKLGMGAWLYDEDRWPSGRAGGIVTSKGEKYLNKYLDVKEVPGGTKVDEQRLLAVFRYEKDGDRVLSYERVTAEDVAAAPGDRTFAVFTVEIGDYVDTLSPEAIAAFIGSTYEVFRKRFRHEFHKTIPGIFTDEPNYTKRPWTDRFADKFTYRRDYDIIANLPCIFAEVGDFHAVRYDYWRTATELYVDAFSKQIYHWCERAGLAFTGHQLLEDRLSSQLQRIGAAMPHYEWMQIPGIDHLARRITDPMLVKQVSSVAHQLGRERVISEMFGCSGWNMSFEDQKWIAEWQYVLGVNFMCQHLALYSLRGWRKRDYPPSIFYQQPWWPEYTAVEDHFARLARALTLGKHVADVLLIHPIESAWATADPADLGKLNKLNDAFVNVTRALCEMHIDLDYGDESIMERHATICDNCIAVGQAKYKLVVLPPLLTIRRSTLELLRVWLGRGGRVICVDRVPEMVDGRPSDEPATLLKDQRVVENSFGAIRDAVRQILKSRIEVPLKSGADGADAEARSVYIQQRDCGQKQLFFLANIDKGAGVDAAVRIRGEGSVEWWDLDTGDIRPMYCAWESGYTVCDLKLAPAGSALLAFAKGASPRAEQPVEWKVTSAVPLSSEWELSLADPNALTLDYCRYKIADGDWSESTPTIWLEIKLAHIVDETPLGLRFTFTTGFREKKDRGIKLVLERPTDFEILVNGNLIQYQDQGWWTDISFKVVDIEDFVVDGENVIELRCRYIGTNGLSKRRQELNVQQYWAKMGLAEDGIPLPFAGDVAEKVKINNILKRGLELESCYLTGDFGVYQDSPRKFVLRDAPKSAGVGDLAENGLCFFRGGIIYRRNVSLSRPKTGRIVLSLERMGAIVTKVRVNGEYAGRLIWRALELDITDFVKDGENEIELEMMNSCRNLLGPHHHPAGELMSVGPGSFGAAAAEATLPGCDPERAKQLLAGWTDSYSFVETGLVSQPEIRYLTAE